MTTATVEGMPQAPLAPQAPPATPALTPEEIQREKNREYQRKSRERKRLGLTGDAAPSVPKEPVPRQATLRVVPAYGVKAIIPPEGPKPVSPADMPVPLSEGIRLEVMAPTFALMAAQQLDDGRLQLLATMKAPIDGPDAPEKPLMAAFGASLDKAADLSGVTMTALEAALLQTAILGVTMVGIYKKLPPMPFQKSEG